MAQKKAVPNRTRQPVRAKRREKPTPAALFYGEDKTSQELSELLGKALRGLIPHPPSPIAMLTDLAMPAACENAWTASRSAGVSGAAPIEQSAISRGRSMLEHEVGQLEIALGELVGKLTPVRRIDPPSACVPSTDPAIPAIGASDLAGELQRRAIEVRGLMYRIRDLHESIEL